MSISNNYYYLCSNCTRIFLFESKQDNIQCNECGKSQFEEIKGRFILRCRKCGLTQNKSAFNILHGNQALRCQSTTCKGPIKVIELGKKSKKDKNHQIDDKIQPKPKRIHSPPPRSLKISIKSNQQKKISKSQLPKINKLPLSASEKFIPFPSGPKKKEKEKNHPGIKIGDFLKYNEHYYEITGKLGTGGMGAVWNARNIKTNKKVAIKEFYYTRFHDPESGNNYCEKYWIRESNITKIQSDSPEKSMHFIGTLKFEQFKIPEYYILLEYIEGKGLDQWYTEKFQNLNQLNYKAYKIFLEQILMPIARHMYYVHQKGIVHRDLTVQNIMIIKKDRYSEEDIIPIIIDWGVAKEIDLEKMLKPRKPYYISAAPEATGIRNRGTPPEVMAGFQPIAATDIYMLGHIMFYLFSGGHYASTAATNEDFVLHPGDFNPNLDLNFTKLVEFMTQYEPADRMENMVKVYDAMTYLLKNTNEKMNIGIKKKNNTHQYYLICDYNSCHIPIPENKIIQLGRDEIIHAGRDHIMDGHIYNALIPLDQGKFSFEIFINENNAFIRDLYSKMGTYISNLTSTNQQIYNNIPIKGLDNVCVELSEANLNTTTIEVPFLAPDGKTYRILFKILKQEV